jgi:PadR family transcriptional regulator, regulatory protein PadR
MFAHYPYIVGMLEETLLGRDRLGDFERRVLMAVLHLRGEGYAVSIADEIIERFGRAVSLGAIYATVDRLEKKGFVSSRLGDPTPQRGGKPKRFYVIEAPGRLALAEAMAADSKLWNAAGPWAVPA